MCVCFFLFEIRDSTDYAPLRLARMTFVELRFFVVVVVSVDGDLKYFSIKNYPNFKSPNKRKQIQICDRFFFAALVSSKCLAESIDMTGNIILLVIKC